LWINVSLFIFIFGKNGSGNEQLWWLAFQRHPIKNNEGCSEGDNKGRCKEKEGRIVAEIKDWRGNVPIHSKQRCLSAMASVILFFTISNDTQIQCIAHPFVIFSKHNKIIPFKWWYLRVNAFFSWVSLWWVTMIYSYSVEVYFES